MQFKATAGHKSTSHLTQTIQLHTFLFRPSSSLRWSPSQHLELQFPSDMDLIGGRVALDDERRRLFLTPCRFRYLSSSSSDEVHDADNSGASNGLVEVQFITRTGSLTSQIGLPRFRALEAAVLGYGGGFPIGVTSNSNESVVGVAGGVGICAFIPMSSVSAGEHAARCQGERSGDYANYIAARVLFWTLHIDDWEFVRHSIESGQLELSARSRVHVFLTSGTETNTQARVERVTESAKSLLGGNEKLEIHFGRMTAGDLGRTIDSKISAAQSRLQTTQAKTILFCGSKALEWQIKLWARGIDPPATVHTTQMQK